MKFRTFVGLAAVVLGACSTTSPNKLTDPQIAMVMRIMNLSEVREADLARQKATDAAVRDYANRMFTEHSAQSSKQDAALSEADVPAEDTPVSRQLDSSSGVAVDRLSALAGAAFDRAYIERAVQAHQDYLTMIDSRLTPAAHKKALRQQLTDLRNLEDKHLTRAKEIEAKLPK